MLTQQEMNELIKIARKHDIYILNDEIYRGLEHGEGKKTDSIVEGYEKGIVISSLSKIYGLVGVRIGWVASKDRALIEQAKAFRRYTSSRNSELSELFAYMALNCREQLLARNRAIIQQNLKLLSDFFARNQDSLSWVPPEGGTLALPKLLLDRPIDQFVDELYQKTQVVLVPDRVFDRDENAFRIAFGKQSMPEALLMLEDFLKQYA